MIPLRYNLRNLRVRWVTTLLTILATALVVGSSATLFGLVDGLQYSLNISGDPLDLLVMRKGSSSETFGGYSLDTAQKLLNLDGIERDSSGRPLAAMELLNIPVVERVDGGRANVIIRGTDPVSPLLRPNFKIVRGRMFEPGRGECIVAQPLSPRFKGMRLNEVFRVSDKEAYRVVGLFTAGGSAAESEVWVDRKDLERNTAYVGYISSVQIRAASPADRDRLIEVIRTDPQFLLLPWKESEYYASQDMTSQFLKFLGFVIASLLTIGAMFASANTMFAAVRSRTREIGTLRALGFSRTDVLISFLGESVLLCALGGLLGMLATLPLQTFLTFGTNDLNSFSEKTIQFRFGPLVLAVSIGMTLAMGLFGGLFPAIRAVKLDIIKALREL